MALSAGESFSGGQVRDSKSRSVVISETTNAAITAGEFYSGGFLCDPDSRTVICQDAAHSALVAGETLTGGDVRDKVGRIACAVETLNAPVSAGSQFSDGWLNDSQGRRIIALDTLGAVLSAGEQFTSGQVRDSVGRLVLANEVAAPVYDAVVLSDSPSYFWKMTEPSGTTATDSADANTGTYQPTVTLNQTGPCSDGEKAVLFDGSTGYVSTTTLIVNPSLHSLEIWFKVTNAYALGGVLFMFGNAQTGVAGSNDRYFWMDNAGLLHWGSTGGAGITNSVAAYNDGNWHHTVVTFSTATGSVLYVDGAQVGSSAQLTTNNYSGYWRIGRGETLGSDQGAGGFNPAPTSAYLAGTLAKAAYYPAVLSAARVTAHYAAR